MRMGRRILTTLRRTAIHAGPTVLGIIVLDFLLLQLMPGDAADVIASESGVATAEISPDGLQVGSMMIMSPGMAASIAACIDAEAATWVGALPPIVTVTVSIDCCPLFVVTISWPHSTLDAPPYCACCWTAQSGTPEGMPTTIFESLQPPGITGAVMPPIVTLPLP